MAKNRKQAKAVERQAKLKAKRLHQEQVARVQNRISHLLDISPKQAVERLSELHRCYPEDRHVLLGLVEACHDAQLYSKLRRLCRDWLRTHPDDREIWRTYAGACFEDSYFYHGEQAARRIVERWPDWEEARACAAMIDAFRAVRPEIVKDFDGQDCDAALEYHENIRDATESSEFQNAIRLAEEGLARWPTNQPMRNNLCQALGMAGEFQAAIDQCREALKHHPANVFAHATLTRALYILGQDQEAQVAKDNLLACESTRSERWVKKAEVLAVMGEDQQLLDLAIPVIADNADEKADPIHRALLRHFAACAKYRLDDERSAKDLWRESVKIGSLSIVQENLEELKLPADERNGAWFHSFGELFSRQIIDDFLAKCAGATHEETVKFALDYVQRHPELRRLIQILLDRGDPTGRELACRLCRVIQDHEMLDQIETFAHGKRGSLQSRMEMIEILVNNQRAESGSFQTWLNGKYSEVMALGFQISYEPMEEEPNRESETLQTKAHMALKRGEHEKAVSYFTKAMEITPDRPSLRFNIASIRQQEPEFDFEAEIREIHTRWPDYGFARMSLASILANQGNVEEAQALASPVLKRKDLHFTEFRSLAMCQIDIALAMDQVSSAQSWLDMARQALPEETDLHDQLELRIAMAELPNRIEQMLKAQPFSQDPK